VPAEVFDACPLVVDYERPVEETRMTTALLALALVVAAPAPKDKDTKKDGPAFVGEWVGVKAEVAGIPLPATVGEMRMEFKANGKVMLKDGDKAAEEGSYTADPKKDPAEIDLTPPPTGGKAETLVGIYKVEGDTLTLCLAVAGVRPTSFESPAGSANMLLTFKRAKKKD
jgi:uncharacterized protein (TIGR03067 family)